VKDTLRLCSVCFNITDTDPCLVCADDDRDRTQVCVVEDAHNLMPIEKSATAPVPRAARIDRTVRASARTI